ncbi:hypothetical protein EV647_0425 [Kribbella sp. VKM Ac-2566]|nr:hypothetical protein EV647_0425 [Kribbella sp. VKM Ac-2566]
MELRLLARRLVKQRLLTPRLVKQRLLTPRLVEQRLLAPRLVELRLVALRLVGWMSRGCWLRWLGLGWRRLAVGRVSTLCRPPPGTPGS